MLNRPVPRKKLPTVAETLKHPAYADAVWNLEATRSGHLPVAEGRGGPFGISWEIHGEGPVHAGKWKRTKKTISGTHTKVNRPLRLRSVEAEALPECFIGRLARASTCH